MLTLEEVLDRADAETRPTHEIANEIAQARITIAAGKKKAAA
jgi:leucine dehydrogenase